MSDLFRKLRENNAQGTDSSSKYGFQGGGHPFRDRPGASTTSKGTMVRPGVTRTDSRTDSRAADGDRESAYHPPVERDSGVVVEWEPPGLAEILKDLGLRILETSIAAAAYTAGEEIAYFFRKRRLFTQRQRDRRDWK